jgi:UDP-N-acetyl-D-mannosaminuronic acid transferase (WecB/TagA/CpsF family)
LGSGAAQVVLELFQNDVRPITRPGRLTYHVPASPEEINKTGGVEVSYKLKSSVLGILIDSSDYDTVTSKILEAACEGRRLSVSALAVHGVMTGVLDLEHRYRLNHLDVVVPDGQPVRWALNLLYKARLRDRVYGPSLMLRVCERAAKQNVPIYLFGSTLDVLRRLTDNLLKRFPGLRIVGSQPSRFRRLTSEEKQSIASEIRAFHAGLVPQAPRWMQEAGLEWLFRWGAEPRRLWSRYVLLNPLYLFLLMLQATRLACFDSEGRMPLAELRYG